MELGEFIRTSIDQIATALLEVQKTHPSLNAENRGFQGDLGHLLEANQYGVFTRVDFDVAVTAETNVNGKAGISVFSIGASVAGDHSSSTVSRIAFSVPLRVPDGERNPEVARKEAAESAKIRPRAKGPY
ncbi:MAG: hypothetical protein ACWA6X_00175 [Bauldia sp.]